MVSKKQVAIVELYAQTNQTSTGHRSLHQQLLVHVSISIELACVLLTVVRIHGPEIGKFTVHDPIDLHARH